MGLSRAGKPPPILDEVLMDFLAPVRYMSRAGLKTSALDHISSGSLMLPRNHMRLGLQPSVESESRPDCSLFAETDVNVRQSLPAREMA